METEFHVKSDDKKNTENIQEYTMKIKNKIVNKSTTT